MLRAIACAGCPRDLGLDQGEACRERIRTQLARYGATGWLRRLRGRAPVEPGFPRHHPQQAERLDGLALGARVPRSALLEALFDRGGARPAGSRLASLAACGALAVGPERSRNGPLLAAALQLSSADALGLVLRTSRPDHGYASVELALAWLAPALAGVNEAGLAGALVAATDAAPDRCLEARAALLLQEGLERFDAADEAVAWCLRRPCGPAASLLWVDAAGGVSGVHLAGASPAPHGPARGVLAAASTQETLAALEKGCADAERLAPDRLHALLAPASAGQVPRTARSGRRPASARLPRPAGALWIEPRARRLGFQPGAWARRRPPEFVSI